MPLRSGAGTTPLIVSVSVSTTVPESATAVEVNAISRTRLAASTTDTAWPGVTGRDACSGVGGPPGLDPAAMNPPAAPASASAAAPPPGPACGVRAAAGGVDLRSAPPKAPGSSLSPRARPPRPARAPRRSTGQPHPTGQSSASPSQSLRLLYLVDCCKDLHQVGNGPQRQTGSM